MAGVGAPLRPHANLDALLVGDDTVREHGTGKIRLIGVFAATSFTVVAAAPVDAS